VIQSFKDSDSEHIFNRNHWRRFSIDLQKAALRKLLLIHGSTDVNDLRLPPGNRLEVLKGDRKGQYSIRINEKYRICFKWNNGNALGVEIVDYH
jgi:proteic killer suppression protein